MTTFATEWEKQLELYPEEYRKAYRRVKRASEILLREPEPQVGLTPKEVIWTKNKTKLYRYIPKQEKTQRVPILLIYALINKPYIMDLTPGNSLVEYLVDRGFDVYMLDWGTFGLEDSHLKFDDFVFDYIAKAVKSNANCKIGRDFFTWLLHGWNANFYLCGTSSAHANS